MSCSPSVENYSENEKFEVGFKLGQQAAIFTNMRLIYTGASGERVQYFSIPYNRINRFCVESAGELDANAKLIIWTKGDTDPLIFQLPEDVNVFYLQSLIAQQVAAL